jgi:hypothetical protein
MLSESFYFNAGVKGPHTLGCLPLWGREGVTLLIRKNFEASDKILPGSNGVK